MTRTFAALSITLGLLACVAAAGLPRAEASANGPRLSVSPRALSFEEPGQVQTLVLTNTGDAPLALEPPRLLETSGGEAAVARFGVADLATTTLAPGASTELRVTFLPGGAADKAPRQAFAALQIPSDDVRQPRDERLGQHVAPVALRAGRGAPLLSILLFFPLLGIPLLFLVPRGRESLTRLVALGTTLVPLALAAAIALRFDPARRRADGLWGLQFVEHHVWIRGFNVEYFLGVDGLSVTMVLLTALVTVVAVGASWSIPLERHVRGYFSLLLLLEVGMIGVFVALDFFLFFVFWELMLLPMYFLIGLWGGPRKEHAAIKFFLYTLVGSVLMLLALIALYHASAPTTLVDGTPARHTFDLMKLAFANDFGGEAPIFGFAFAKLVWLGLFLAFAIKVPMVPLHTWLPDAHVEAPTAISVILAGVLLKMGTYGLVRISWPILPEATRWAASGVAFFGVASILYGALCAMAQKDLKRMVAYSSVSHMGFVLLGLSALTEIGISGALVQMFNHGVITSMLFLLVGVVYDRTHVRGLEDFGGLARVMPRYAFLFGLAFMASLGMPGLSGFIGEALVFFGSFPAFRGLVMAAGVSLVFTAAYHLTAIQKVQLGPFNERWRGALVRRDLDARELATLVPLAALVVLLGFWPAPLLGAIASGVADLVADLGEAAAAARAGLP